MRILKFLFLGVLLVPVLLGQGVFNLNGPYDLNRNGITETFSLNSNDKSIQWLEFEQLSKKKELWSYSLPNAENFLDIEILDINQDGNQDIIALLDVSLSINEKEWIYIFLGKIQIYQNGIMQLKITKTKDQDVKTLILKAIFICLELCVVPKVESLNHIRKQLSFFKQLTIQI